MSEWSGLLCCDVTPPSLPLHTPLMAPTCLSFAECFLQPVGPHILGLVPPAPLAAPRLGPPLSAPALLFAHGDSQDDPRVVRVSRASLVTGLSLVTGPHGHQVTGCSHLGSQVGTDSDTLRLTRHCTPAPVALAASPGLACHCCLAQPRDTHHWSPPVTSHK